MRLAVMARSVEEVLFRPYRRPDDLRQHLLGPQAVEAAHAQVVHDQLVAEPLGIDPAERPGGTKSLP